MSQVPDSGYKDDLVGPSDGGGGGGGGEPTGPAGGDLYLTYPDPGVKALRGVELDDSIEEAASDPMRLLVSLENGEIGLVSSPTEGGSGGDLVLTYTPGATTLEWIAPNALSQQQMQEAIDASIIPLDMDGKTLGEVGDPVVGTDGLNYRTVNKHVSVTLTGDLTMEADDWKGMTVTFTGALTEDVLITLVGRTGLDQDSTFVNRTTGGVLMLLRGNIGGGTYLGQGQVKSLVVTSLGNLIGEDTRFFRTESTVSLVRGASGTYNTTLPRTPPCFRAVPWLVRGTATSTGTGSATQTIRIGTTVGGQEIQLAGTPPVLDAISDPTLLGSSADALGLFWFPSAQTPTFQQQTPGGVIDTGEVTVRSMGESLVAFGSPPDLRAMAWWDTSRKDTLFQDSAGTTPVVSVADPIRRISDLSGNGKHYTAPVSGNRGFYFLTGNKASVYMDGSASLLVSPAISSVDVVVLMVARVVTPNAGVYGRAATTTEYLYNASTFTAYTGPRGNLGGVIDSATMFGETLTSNFYQFSVVFRRLAGPNFYISRGGVVKGSSSINVGTVPLNATFALAASDSSGANRCELYMSEMIVFDTIDDHQINMVQKYLKLKWGTP